MAIKCYNIRSEQFIAVLKDCHLCGSSFSVPIESPETICSKCKELWKEFVASRGITLSVKVNRDTELKGND